MRALTEAPMRSMLTLSLLLVLGPGLGALRADSAATAPSATALTPAAAVDAAAASPTASAAASAPAPAPAPAAAATPVPTPGSAITVTLKDGQVAHLALLRYDRFFLTAVNPKGTSFDIPWAEVAAVEGPDAGADLALMRGNITGDPALVGSIVAPRDPGHALGAAFWPGVLLHGSGYRYAGDNGMFVDLAGAELFGVVVGVFGAYINANPDNTNLSEDQGASKVLIATGAGIFLVTWVWDMFSPLEAAQLNKDKGLALLPFPGGAQLACSF